MKECDPLPEPRNISDLFPPNRDKVTVLLAIPSRKQNGLNCVESEAGNSHDVRFSAETNLLHDDITGIDEKPRGDVRYKLRVTSYKIQTGTSCIS